MQGKVFFNPGVKDEYKDLMRKHKASLKKTELQERLATMLKEDVLSKKEYVSTTLSFVLFIHSTYVVTCRMLK